MRAFFTQLLVLLPFLITVFSASQQNCDQVNSFIATSGLAYGYGSINPAAQYPSGALRLGPDTTYYIADLTYRHFSGYNYQDKTIRAFSHTHLVGAGVNDLGSVGVMPITGSKTGVLNVTHNSWWSDFRKETEVASPGFYSVYLDEPKVKSEMMAISTLAGIHRYTWDSLSVEENPTLVIDICHDSKIHNGADSRCLEGSLTIDENNSNIFTGFVHTKDGLSGNLTVFVYAELIPSTIAKDSGVKKWTLCSKDSSSSSHLPSCQEDIKTLDAPEKLYAFASFGKSVQKQFSVELRIGISFISTEVAKQNLQAALLETSNYDKLATRTKQVWCNSLNFYSVEGMKGDSDFLTQFHSANYRALMSPTDYTEDGGLYLGIDRQVHNAASEREAKYGAQEGSIYQYRWFSDFSFWDTFRTVHPWLFLINEDLSMGLARSITEITIQQNAFPRWVLGAHESSCMVGNHGASFIVEMLLAGLGSEIDINAIQKIFLQQSVQPWPINGRTDLTRYLTEGYVSQDVSGDSAVETLTYAYDDYLLGVMSRHVGDSQSADDAFSRSKNYGVIWSRDQHVFCPKYANGEVQCPPDPAGLLSWQYYREGDALHYSWFVPHDPEGLMGLYESPEAYDASLQSFLANHVTYHEKYGSAVPNPYYWAGNEHDFLAPWLFNVGPNCTNTQYWTRKLTYMHFSNTPHGIPGNEDYGSMATWFIFATLGIFPQAGTDRFFIGAPRVTNAKISLTHWNRANTMLEINVINNSQENTYIEKLLVNGKEWTSPFIARSVLTEGDVKLEFTMSSSPTSGLCSKK